MVFVLNLWHYKIMTNVIKANGSVEEYNEAKVLHSIKRAGIPEVLHQDVVNHINSKIYDNIPTKEIYGHVINFLGNSEYPYARSSYSLKQAIIDLGPTGYPFEDFVSEILISLGYSTEVRQILKGNCVTHEIDIIAKKDSVTAMVEAKFHNSVGIRTDVHIPMYTKARFDDIREKYQLTEAWVITNTKATTDAVAYAECVGMKTISWSYPDGKSLRDLIEQAGLHPITILTTLTQGQKVKLLEDHIVRCKVIHENPDTLNILSLSQEEKAKVINEVNFVCRGEHRE
jgi:Holliday junction resolvase-like predicted endonuclease